MRIININIRGLGGRIKKREIRELVEKEKVEFMCIQETKMSSIDQRLACVLWGNIECDWIFSGSDGISGGLCCLWDKSVFERKEIWGDKGVLGVSGLWLGKLVHMVNVYAPCNAEGKRSLWKVIEDKVKGKEGDRWCICGTLLAEITKGE